METKFYVGQRVRSNKFGEGVVVSIKESLHSYPIVCEFGQSRHSALYTDEGRHWADEDVDLFPIDPPRVVLTEWQKKQLREYVREEFKYTALFNFFDRLESILSSPEPPKYQPKQGEAVLVKVCKDYPWVTGVFSNMEYDAYKCYGVSPVNFCRPFDASLIGQVTSD